MDLMEDKNDNLLESNVNKTIENFGDTKDIGQNLEKNFDEKLNQSNLPIEDSFNKTIDEKLNKFDINLDNKESKEKFNKPLDNKIEMPDDKDTNKDKINDLYEETLSTIHAKRYALSELGLEWNPTETDIMNEYKQLKQNKEEKGEFYLDYKPFKLDKNIATPQNQPIATPQNQPITTPTLAPQQSKQENDIGVPLPNNTKNILTIPNDTLPVTPAVPTNAITPTTAPDLSKWDNSLIPVPKKPYMKPNEKPFYQQNQKVVPSGDILGPS